MTTKPLPKWNNDKYANSAHNENYGTQIGTQKRHTYEESKTKPHRKREERQTQTKAAKRAAEDAMQLRQKKTETRHSFARTHQITRQTSPETNRHRRREQSHYKQNESRLPKRNIFERDNIQQESKESKKRQGPTRKQQRTWFHEHTRLGSNRKKKTSQRHQQMDTETNNSQQNDLQTMQCKLWCKTTIKGNKNKTQFCAYTPNYETNTHGGKNTRVTTKMNRVQQAKRHKQDSDFRRETTFKQRRGKDKLRTNIPNDGTNTTTNIKRRQTKTQFWDNAYGANPTSYFCFFGTTINRNQKKERRTVDRATGTQTTVQRKQGRHSLCPTHIGGKNTHSQ